MHDLGKRIEQRRKALGLSQTELAEQIGIGKTSLYQWEAGITHPRLSRFYKLCILLDISPNTLLNLPEPSHAQSK